MEPAEGFFLVGSRQSANVVSPADHARSSALLEHPCFYSLRRLDPMPEIASDETTIARQMRFINA